MEMTNINNIPAEKFRFADKNDFKHDSKFETKPVSYFQGAFRRFCKNKGAVVGGVVVMMLVLFAILAPLFTPFTPSYYDQTFMYATPRLNVFANSSINFWDGCKQKSNVSYVAFLKDYALAQETGKDVIKDGIWYVNSDQTLYSYRFDTYYGVGFKYKLISLDEFNKIQEYQNRTGRQVIYPVLDRDYRASMTTTNQSDANIYYKVENPKASILRPVINSEGKIVTNYWKYEEGKKSGLMPEYNSLRIEGEDGVVGKDGKTYFYSYGYNIDTGVQVRVDYYEYYTYEHTEVLKDGISDPTFWFGTTKTGKDIFACLSHGARFSFIFALIVAVSNFVVGVIWGSIAGYFGGKTDLFMERFTDILGSVPTMITITLLKYHMGQFILKNGLYQLSNIQSIIVLFIAFFATGWIGMAGTTRMQFYRFKNQEYVLAARTLGASDKRVMFKHIFPNGLGTIVTSMALVIPAMIYSETSLSYLGIINLEAGNITSVGTLIAAAKEAVVKPGAAYVAFFPCMFLCMLMLSFNLFGNGLRDAFNPSLRGSED